MNIFRLDFFENTGYHNNHYRVKLANLFESGFCVFSMVHEHSRC